MSIGLSPNEIAKMVVGIKEDIKETYSEMGESDLSDIEKILVAISSSLSANFASIVVANNKRIEEQLTAAGIRLD